MSTCAAAFACVVSFALIAPPNARAGEALERVFVGTPTQLTLPPDFRDELPRDNEGDAGQACKAPGEQDASEQLDDACSPEASVSRSPAHDDKAPEAKSAELGRALANSGTDTGKSNP